MHHHNIFITILTLFFIFYKPASALGRGAIVGGWKPIKNLTDPEVIDVAKFAVEEHNKQDKVTLKFGKVIKGERQVVAGFNYNLTITAGDGKAVNNYVALVWDKPGRETSRELVSFKGPV